MPPMKRVLLLAALFLLPACWSRTQIVHPVPVGVHDARFTLASVTDATGQVPLEVMSGMKPYLERVLTDAGSYDVTPASGTLRLTVEVVRFKMRKTFWRIVFGGYSGHDVISSRVTLADASGAPVGEEVISSFNQTNTGGADFMVPANVRDIARHLVGSRVRM